jgi:hypothetical protein
VLFRPQLGTPRAAEVTLMNTDWGRNPTSGLIDEVRLYNKILTAEEVRRLHQAAR